ncbi:Uncharacterized protein Rs2_24825 [Raphanus sativus]|nr:Uncharacterized protein Rs2_24825 [Raphanus sativus]
MTRSCVSSEGEVHSSCVLVFREAEALTAPSPPALGSGRRKFLQLLCRRLLFPGSEGLHGLAPPAFRSPRILWLGFAIRFWIGLLVSLVVEVWERFCSPVMVVVRLSFV